MGVLQFSWYQTHLVTATPCFVNIQGQILLGFLSLNCQIFKKSRTYMSRHCIYVYSSSFLHIMSLIFLSCDMCKLCKLCTMVSGTLVFDLTKELHYLRCSIFQLFCLPLSGYTEWDPKVRHISRQVRNKEQALIIAEIQIPPPKKKYQIKRKGYKPGMTLGINTRKTQWRDESGRHRIRAQKARKKAERT